MPEIILIDLINRLISIKQKFIEYQYVFYYFLFFELVRNISSSFFVSDFSLYYLVKGLFFGVLSNIIFLMTPYIFLKINLRKYLILISPILIISNVFYLTHLFHLKAPITLGAIAVIAETTPKEATEFIYTVGFKTIISSILLSLAPLVIFFKIKKLKTHSFKEKLPLTVLLPVYLILIMLFSNWNKFNVRQLIPFNHSFIFKDIKQIAYYYREQKRLNDYIKNRPNYKFGAEYVGVNEKMNVVLIIGESMSKYHMQLYGYPRETTPKLSVLDNLYVFNDVISPATQTRESIIRMLSMARGKYLELFYDKGSILTAAKEAGYQTYWLSNQMILGISDTETSVIALDADYTKFINSDWKTASLDGNLLPHIQKAVDQPHDKKMLIVHMLGNHFKYENRYDKTETYFFDDNFLFPSYLKEKHKTLINHYDNSIRYSDQFIYNVISQVKSTGVPTVVIYLSDHGEEVFDDENLYSGHGSPKIRKEAVDIPFLIWYSENYNGRLNSNDIQQFLNNKYSTEDLFHTLADILELEFDDFDKTKSIVSSQFIEQERKVLNSNNQLIKYSEISEK